MQGTLVMLVALSGLGCHNKGCDIAFGPSTYTSCFSGGCYANAYPGPAMPACYAGGYGGYSGCYASYSGCYGGYGGCYGGWGGGCYGGWYNSCYSARHCLGGCLSRLFSCFHRRCGGCGGGGYGYAGPACYASAYNPAVFGSALGMSYGPVTTGQSMMIPSTQGGAASAATPSEMTTPVPPTPATPKPATPSMEGATPPPPVPATPPAPKPPTT